MNQITLALVVGIAGSLIATGLFVTISEIFRRILIPWYADRIYRGVRIDGEWVEKSLINETRSGFSMTLSIQQSGDTIVGIYTHTMDDDTDVYVMKGVLRDQYLHVIATPQSNRHIDGIVMLLKVDTIKSAQYLVGSIICRADASDQNVRAIPNVEFLCKDSS